jgi:hypothetical protein
VQTRARRSAALGAVVTLLLTSGCTSWRSKEKPIVRPATAELTPGASNHVLEDVTIAVAENTVNVPTELYVFKPEPKPDEPSLPFGGNGLPNVQFDISLARGAQPLQPLDVKIPLSGKFLPPGANPEHALLYSPNKAGEWRLVPGIVENGVLHAQVASLSPKHIVYATPAAVIQAVLGDLYTQSQQDAGDCKHEQTTADGKVLLGGSSWEKSANSAVHPCLTQQNGEIKLKIANNSAIMWSMATSGPAIDANTSSNETEMIRLIAKWLPHDKNVKAFLAEDHDAWVDVDTSSLPLTVQMRADATPFLANSIWIAVKFGVGLFSGKGGNDVATLAGEVVKAPELIDCMTDAFKSTADNKLDVGGIVRVALSECGQKIAQLIDALAPPTNWWERVVGTFFTVTEGIAGAVDTINKAYNGIVQQIKGDVTIVVKSDAPPKPKVVKPPCATLTSFKEALSREGVPVQGVSGIDCSNGWAKANVSVPLSRDSYDGYTLIHFVGGSWSYVRTMNEPIFYGTPENDKLCSKLPADFRKTLCVRI